MTLWLSVMPSWLSLIIILIIANGVALSLLWTARRLYARVGITSGPNVVNAWATAAGALCAMLFAFTTVTLWNAQMRTVTNLDTEASAMRLLSRDIAPSQRPIVRRYVQLSIAEWPQLCGGVEDRNVENTLATLQRVAKPSKPEYVNDLFTQLGAAEDLRNRRWQDTGRAVPDELWFALIVVSLALAVVMAIALPEYAPTHVALTVVIASALGALFWVTVLLEYPFCGPTKIGPDSLLLVLRAHGL